MSGREKGEGEEGENKESGRKEGGRDDFDIVRGWRKTGAAEGRREDG